VTAGRCTGVILAGGLASRYAGVPKGLERVAGTRIIDRVAATLADATDELLLVANDSAADTWLPGVRRVSDVQVGLGSLGGIHAALHHAAGPVVVVAWDMPFVPAGLITALRRAGESADAAVPTSDSKRGVEPLCAYYSAACLAPIERRLEAGDRRVVAFFEDVRVTRLDESMVSRFGDPAVMFMNVNTPEDLALAERYASTTHGGHHRQEA
jgi:molybdopterin-guanine dinucleotide biosynthesis protein A